MAVRRDSVDRVRNLIRLPITLHRHTKKGDTITLTNVKERPIVPEIKDPMAGFAHPVGDNYGDAVFDGAPEFSTYVPVLGTKSYALGFFRGGAILLRVAPYEEKAIPIESIWDAQR